MSITTTCPAVFAEPNEALFPTTDSDYVLDLIAHLERLDWPLSEVIDALGSRPVAKIICTALEVGVCPEVTAEVLIDLI